MSRQNAEQLAKDAAIARSDLNIFYCVIGALENGTISNNASSDAEKIITRCKAAAERCLRRYDAAISKLST